MPEGLSPIEVDKQLHEHTTKPHQPSASAGATRHSQAVQIGEALLLSLVTIAAAWWAVRPLPAATVDRGPESPDRDDAAYPPPLDTWTQPTVGVTCGRAGGAAVSDGDRPNILVIWGDDIGISNLSCYS
jgi:hypothetical protein